MSFGMVIFRGGEREFFFQQVVSAAHFRGEAESTWKNLQEGLSCTQYAEEEGFSVDAEELQKASELFRYRNELITAQETERWLEERNLSVEDFSNYLERNHWHSRFASNLPDICSEYPPSPKAVEDALWAELILEGRFKAFTLPLAQRVAAKIESPDFTVPREGVETERELFFRRAAISSGELERWLTRFRCPRKWFEEMVEMDALYQRMGGAILSPERCHSELQAQHLPLTRIEAEGIFFPSWEAAREAFLCLTEDREGLAEVGRRSGSPVTFSSKFIRDLSEETQQAFFSASPGEILPPVEQGGNVWIFRVRQKIKPSLEDPDIRILIGEKARQGFFQSLVDKHIHWIFSPE